MTDTEKEAKASAVIYSIVESAKANDLNIYEYLNYLLEEKPQYVLAGKEIPERMMPWSAELPEKVRKQKV